MRLEIETGPRTREIITVDGVKISLALLRCLAHPDPSKLYRMVWDDQIQKTIVTMVSQEA